jgi:hypothetical protein
MPYKKDLKDFARLVCHAPRGLDCVSARLASLLIAGTQESGRCGVTRSAHAYSSNNEGDSQRKDLQVQERRPIIDIPNIVCKFLLPRKSISTADLCPACNAGLNEKPTTLFLRVQRHVLNQKWAGANEAHVAL